MNGEFFKYVGMAPVNPDVLAADQLGFCKINVVVDDPGTAFVTVPFPALPGPPVPPPPPPAYVVDPALLPPLLL